MNPTDFEAHVMREIAVSGFGAEAATYTPPAPHAAIGVPCTVMFRQPRLLEGGGVAPIVAASRELRLLRADVPAPCRSATVVRIAAPSETWRLLDLLEDAQGYTLWSVARDRA